MAESLEQELQFISGALFDLRRISRSYRWLFKYFKSRREKMFVRYYLEYQNTTHFIPRTGCYFTKRNLTFLKHKIRILLMAQAKAKANIDLELLTDIEIGKCSWRKLNNVINSKELNNGID